MHRPCLTRYLNTARLSKAYSSVPNPALSHVVGPSGEETEALLESNIFEQLLKTAHAKGRDDVFVTCAHEGFQKTWHAFAAEASDLAAGLLRLGYQPGDKIGIWLPNFYEWLLLQFASHKLGVVVVNINPAYKATELAYSLNFVGVKGVLLAENYQKAAFRNIMAMVPKESVPDLQHIFTIRGDSTNSYEDELETIPLKEVPIVESNLSVAEKALLQKHFEEISPHDAANIQYTSGSTGNPKPAALTHHNILNNGFFVGAGMRYTSADKVCIPVPLYHCFGTVLGVMASITHGAPVFFPAPTFCEKATIDMVEKHHITSLYSVPTMFIKCLEEVHKRDNPDLSSLRTGIMAGSTCPPKVMQDVSTIMNMNEVTICYGMTETSPVSFQTPPGTPQDLKCETVGTVLPHVEVKIIDDNGNIVPRNTVGELCTKGYGVMQGYYNMPEATKESISEDGYMHSGDLATIDDDGFCRIVGRKKDMIIRGGENIYPAEVEAYLFTSPLISEVAVTAVPHDVMGEQVAAFVVPKEGVAPEDITVASLKAFCKDQIAHYKVPTVVEVVSAFPLTATGKVQKFVLQEQYAAKTA